MIQLNQELKSFLEQLRNRQEEISVAVRKISGRLGKLGDPQMVLKRLDDLEGRNLTFRQFTTQSAAKVIPFSYRVTINFTAGDTARTPGTTKISEEGWFFADRIYMAWLPTAASAGDNQNRWRPISSGNPFIAGSQAVAGATIADALDFVWEYDDGRAQRKRQTDALPSDILYRQDSDGLLGPEGDGFGPNSTVQFFVTPLDAVTNDGTLYIVLQGVQCLDVLKG